MPAFTLPAAEIPAALPDRVKLQLASSAPGPPEGDRWLHEIKHDGHRLLAIAGGDTLRLRSCNGHDRTALFGEPFRALLAAGLPPLVLDGEIAVPDDRGVTHIDALNAAIRGRCPARLAYFAFDLLHLDGHDLQRCAVEDRKALLREVIAAAGGERVVYVDHLVGQGPALFDAVCEVGGEGIVSKRAGSPYRGGPSRDWFKTKVSEEGAFVTPAISSARRLRSPS
jgi:bifunctional non-homologous end joining protein LigD